MDEPRVTRNASALRYELHVGDELAGTLLFARNGPRLFLLHTELEEAYEGKGLASRLVRGALEDARAEGLDVVPRCVFVRRYIERHPEYADLLAQPS